MDDSPFSKAVDCSHGWEDPACRQYQAFESIKPSLITEDIVNPEPNKLQPLFSRESWLYYWSAKFGESSKGINDFVFHMLDQHDNLPSDGFIDLGNLSREDIGSIFDNIHTTSETELEVLSQMRGILIKYCELYLRTYYVTEHNNQLVGVDENGNIVGLHGTTLTEAWHSIKEKYPDER